jgi:hypothetical protein
VMGSQKIFLPVHLSVTARQSRVSLIPLQVWRRIEGDELHMPRIRLILEDDEGNPIPQAEQRIYQLQGDCENLDEIERAVEGFKRRALPEVEHALLARAQERFVARGGKSPPPTP